MDVPGVHQMRKSSMKHSKRSNSKKDIKVVHISSPMKFEICATQFRALVQELTGKDSDVAARFMDNSIYDSSENSATNSDTARVADDRVLGLPLPTSNHESLFETFDDGLISEGVSWGCLHQICFMIPLSLMLLEALVLSE